MKKKIIGLAFLFSIGGIIALNLTLNAYISNVLDIALTNIEAMATGEGGGYTRYENHTIFLTEESCDITVYRPDGTEEQYTGHIVGCTPHETNSCISGCFM